MSWRSALPLPRDHPTRERPVAEAMFDSVEDVISAVSRGELVVVLDDEHRENEGDLIMAADLVTPAAINFMVTHGRGLVCVPLSRARGLELGLSAMATSKDRYQTAFTVAVDAREGVTTGISAADRALTIRLLADAKTGRGAFDVPGHVFPLIARDGGVLERAGHTEAAVDLARLAGRQPVGVICEIMKDDGSMARLPDLASFVKQHGLKWCSISDLQHYRQRHETLVRPAGSVRMPSYYAERDFDLYCYEGIADGKEHLALVYGEVAGQENLLVRVHSECLTGDVFRSARCDCGEQLERAILAIVEAGRGVIVYLRQEGRGIGLINKIKAYRLQDQGLDTVEANQRLGFAADLRDYSVAAQILRDLKVQSIRLLTNNPGKVEGLTAVGMPVLGREPLIIPPGDHNAFYLRTKRERLGHLI